MPVPRKRGRGGLQKTPLKYRQSSMRGDSMSQDGAGSLHSTAESHSPAEIRQNLMASTSGCKVPENSEYTPLSKAELDISLDVLCTKLLTKFQTELQKSTSTLSQEIAALGSRTDLLENKHDELAITFNDLSREHDNLSSAFAQLQAHVEDLDNRNRRNNIRIRGAPETITDLPAYSTKLFLSLLPEQNPQSFTCDRIQRALRAKPPPDKPPRDIILCMKDFLVKEEIMRAARSLRNITLDGVHLQLYPDISQATLDRRRKMKEITTILSTARIRYRWGFPFKLIIPHNGTTYIATSIPEGQDILFKLGLWNPNNPPRTPSTPRQAPIWNTPSLRGDRRRPRHEAGQWSPSEH